MPQKTSMLSSLTNNQKAILYALVGYTAFSFADTATKWLTAYYSTFQIIHLVSLISITLLLILRPWIGEKGADFNKEDLKIHALRGVLNFSLAILIVYSFSILSLASIYTMVFTVPIISAVLAVPLYKQKLKISRLAAILAGFLGVLFALQPGSNDFDGNLLIPLAASFLISLMFLVSQNIKKPSHFSLSFYPALGSVVLSIYFVVPDFVLPEIEHLPVMLTISVFSTLGLIGVSTAFIKADAALVSPFTYTEMIWAILFGYYIFGDVPNFWMMIGAVIIIISGIYLVWSEKKNSS